MDPLLLGIDMGTASSKGVLVTPAGVVVVSAVRSHGTSTPRPGWVEVDAEAVWWEEVVSLVGELVGQAGGREIAGVCVSGVGPSLVLTDGDGRPLRPAILYGIDTRAGAEIEELTQRLGAGEILERCGSELSSQAVGPKMLWVQRHERQVWEATARWWGSSSFVVGRLTGEHVMDHHTASQYDPLYDVAAQDWARDWAQQVAPGVPLPRLAWPGEVVGAVTAAAAQATGLAQGTPVCAGTVDAWAEAFSVGVRGPGDLMLMYGSTMFFVQVLSGLGSARGLWTTCGVEAGQHTLAAGLSTSGSLTGWVAELTGGASFSDLVAEASAVPVGSGGLVVLPYFAGERTPIFDPRARGVVAGLTLQHGRGHLFRAVYEGIAFGIRHVLELFEESVEPPRRVVAVGGGTQGGLWTQIVSDVTGRAQEVPEQRIGASYGDALMAAIAVGLVPPETDWTRIARVVQPDPATAELYGELYEVYRDLYPATKDAVHRLAAIQER